MTTEPAVAEVIPYEAPPAETAERPQMGLARVLPVRTLALEDCSDEEFEAHLVRWERTKKRIDRLVKTLLVESVDYGTIEGVAKPSLAKSGSEKLLKAFDLVALFHFEELHGDGVTGPTIRYRVKAEIRRGAADGPLVAEGYGACNSWERKYRWRKGSRACPSCGSTTLKRSKYAPKGSPQGEPGGWWCPKDTGCGADFHHDEPAIVGQSVADVENRDPLDLENTILKMALKRAQVDGTLRATATSEYFTQDVEDGDHGAARPAPVQAETRAAPAQSAADKAYEKAKVHIVAIRSCGSVEQLDQTAGAIKAQFKGSRGNQAALDLIAAEILAQRDKLTAAYPAEEDIPF